ncbi:MAG: dihydroorotate dehydrogenase-like protein [Bacteroidales bacterium]
MAKLRTTYMGIELKNPIIIGASNMVTDHKFAKKLEEAGAAALVYKSLFEEQVLFERIQLQNDLEAFNEMNAEMTRLFPTVEHAGPKEYLVNLKKLKDSVDIPVFASLNALHKDTWVEYASLIQETGVDGIELNFYTMPEEFDRDAALIEEHQLETLAAVKRVLKIPVAVKLSPFYSNPLHVISKMDDEDVDAFVLFNRFFQPDIDLENLKLQFPYNLTPESDNRLSLRFAGLLYGNINADICANTGIFKANDVLKMLLAGATSVQVVSAVMKNGADHIRVMLEGIERWMDAKGFEYINQFQGMLAREKVTDPFAYKRAQYVDILLKSRDFYKTYPLK